MNLVFCYEHSDSMVLYMALTKLHIFNNFSCFSSVKAIDVSTLHREEQQDLCSFLQKYNHPYDILYFEDVVIDRVSGIDYSVPVMGISHGTEVSPKITFPASHVLASASYMYNCRYIPASPGNIFTNFRKKRTRKVAMFSRLCKVSYEFLKNVCDLLSTDTIDAYVPRKDSKNSIDNRIFDILELKNPVRRDSICKLYNKYEFVVIPEQECLSLPLREALLCGCVPILSHNILHKHFSFFNDCLKFIVFTNYDQNTIRMIQEYLADDSGIQEVQSRFGFESMIREMMKFVSSVLATKVEWIPKKEIPKYIGIPRHISAKMPFQSINIPMIEEYIMEKQRVNTHESSEYYDTGIDWNKVEV